MLVPFRFLFRKSVCTLIALGCVVLIALGEAVSADLGFWSLALWPALVALSGLDYLLGLVAIVATARLLLEFAFNLVRPASSPRK